MLPNSATLDTYGGPKANYSPVIDPTTDEDAKHRNWYVSDTAMMTATAPRAMRSFVGASGGNPTDPSSGFVHASMWGSTPSDKPAVVRASAGVWDITYPEVVNTPMASEPEEMGGGEQAQIALNFRRAEAQVQCSDGTLRHARAEVTGPNTVRVRGWTAAGALDDLHGQTITVWIW